MFRTFQQNVSDYHEESGCSEESGWDQIVLYTVVSLLRGAQCDQIQGV